MPIKSVEEAINQLRKIASERETIYQAYVVDEQMHLQGTVSAVIYDF
ncbi:hypothetical protein ACT691_20025 [Vibrio metschnikovii]